MDLRIESRENLIGASLMVQWLRLRAPNTGGMGLIPGQGTGKLSCPPSDHTHTRIEPYSEFCFLPCPWNTFGEDGPPKPPRQGQRWSVGGLLSLCPCRSTLHPDVVMYGCESWTVKKVECRRTDAFELWCWRRLLRVPWTARRFNQSILKEISPEYSLEGLMLKLKL